MTKFAKLVLGFLAVTCTGMVFGCAGGAQIVSQSFSYTPQQQSDHQWRALLAALDDCHREGYQDAYPVGKADAACDRHDAKGCSHFQATQSYECIGMGYQQN